MDALKMVTLVAGAFLTGAAIPTFLFHYQRFWDTCRGGSEAARRVHRGVKDLLGSLETFEAAAASGRPSFYRKIQETSHRTKALFKLGDSLFDLRDEALEREVEHAFRNVRSFLAHGLTVLMAETGTDDDGFRVPGAPAYAARQRYLQEIPSVHLPELDLVLRRIRSLTSPWGFWWRSLTTVVPRARAYLAESRLPSGLKERPGSTLPRA